MINNSGLIIPVAATQLWRATEAKAGIYIILSGKVRLLDKSDNLITTISVGESYGELTLFPEENFQSYIARASTDLNLCYLNGDLLRDLMQEYPSISDRLKARAEIWDLLLLCRQNSRFPRHTSQVPGMLKALSLCQSYSLNSSEKILNIKDYKLCILHRGQLLNSEGKTLTSVNISLIILPTGLVFLCW